MKKKILNYYLTSLFILSSIIVFGQSEFAAPEITPTSPEAANMGRYGNVALNSATGQMNYSVPLHSISVDGNNWPISLNYNYSGLILEGKPSLSGLGWNLSGSGSITKEVRGLPDGHPQGYYGASNVKADIDALITDHLAGQPNQTEIGKFINFVDGQYDTEIDKYTVNVGGMRFSFKLIKNASSLPTPYYLSNHNYQVEVLSMHSGHFEVTSFVVTDDKGVKYYFDNDDREYVVEDPGGNTPFVDDKTTSWMLSRIDYNNGESIDIDYHERVYFSYDFYATGVVLEADVSNGPANQGSIEYATGYEDGMRQSEMVRQVLNTITFPDGVLNFSTTNVDTNRELYSSLSLINNNSVTVKSFDFTYAGNRDALTKITMNGENYFDFEYFGQSPNPGFIPPFVDALTANKPLDQDFWKYYNAAANQRAISLGSDGYDTDNKPMFSATRLGALSKIKYKTGGYTKVEYEQNKVKEAFTGQIDGPVSMNRQILVKLNPTVQNNEREVVYTHTFTEPVRAFVSHKINGRIWDNYFQLSISKTDGACNLPSECYDTGNLVETHYPEMADYLRGQISPGDATGECEFYPIPIMCPTIISTPTGPDDIGSPDIHQEDSSRGQIYISPGTYEFKITTFPPNSASSVFHTGSIYGELRVLYHDASDENGNTPTHINKSVGGIHVKRLTDYDENGNQTTSKYYNYNDDEGFSTAKLNQIPLYSDIHTWNHTDTDVQSTPWTQVKKAHSLGGYTALNLNHGTPVFYSRIKTYETADFGINPISDIIINPIGLKKAGGSLNLPTDSNPDGSPIVTAIGSTIGTPVTSGSAVYPNGCTIKTFHYPQEDNITYTYPRIPKQEDLSKAAADETFILDSNNNEKSSSDIGYQTIRHTLLTGSENDADNSHPWSFKLFKKLNLDIDWDSACYCFPGGSGAVEIPALKSLYGIVAYREVEARRLPNYDYNKIDDVIQSKTLVYDTNLQVQSIISSDSRGNEIKQEFDYPYELVSETQYQNMVNNNQISTPVQTRVFKGKIPSPGGGSTDFDQLSAQKTDFIQIPNNGYKPFKVHTAKGDDSLEERIEYTYDSDGKIIQYQQNNATPTAIIWGYDQQYPVAKVENAYYADVAALSAFSSLPIVGSLNSGQETALRNLPNALVTTYTYIPLVGVTTVTDPKGYTMKYEYDSLNRLIIVKDHTDHIISKNEYRYKNQN